MELPARYLDTDDIVENRPVHAVWEITLACNLKCHHCGSRAGKRRLNELSTEECLDVVHQLARLGTREVTLIGGEAYLRKDWVAIIHAVRDAGMMCTLQTGGRGLNDKLIRQAADAGLQAAGVSVDGLRNLHDRLRGVAGSFAAAVDVLQRFREHNIVTSVNTQITKTVLPQLRTLLNLLIDSGVKNWQVQLTVAMGRAADNPDLLMQPYQMLELMPLLADLYQEAARQGVLLQPGNNIGYFGPYESLLRGSGAEDVHWGGCGAGRNVIGIEADGTVKGCPSLATDEYAGGNIRDMTLHDLWTLTSELAFSRDGQSYELSGFCGGCYYAEVCAGGCTWTADSLLGQRGNNPYCHHRALELQKQGLRERVSQVAGAPGRSFDHGRFEVVLESFDGKAVAAQDRKRKVYGKLQAKRKRAFLELCRGCNRHVLPGEITCPHCGGDINQLAQTYEKKLIEARRAHHRLLTLLE